ncbi:MAG TPA: hypothetical protein EYP10_09860, partial [Armatimonadetes bacterium]|nr:hypothetical protein [Armatimonadota bacterium]
MSAFSYAALDEKGKQLRGVLEADSARQVRQMLRDKGWVPLAVEVAADGAVRSSGSNWSMRRGMNTAKLALITRQLATLVQSSMPLEEALTAVAAQAENNRIRSIMLGVRGRVLEGHSLAHALQDSPQAFPQMYRAMISAGEQSGHLDAVLERLADYTETAQDSGQQVKLALLYPCILLLVAMLIVIGLMTFVVPQVVGVFVDQDIKVIKKIRQICKLDIIQLHGNESPAFCQQLGGQIFKAIRLKGGSMIRQFADYPDDIKILIDAWDPVQTGGTGEQISFRLLDKIEDFSRIIIAGGVGEENVAAIVETYHPFGIDINSKIEKRPGIKDHK